MHGCWGRRREERRGGKYQSGGREHQAQARHLRRRQQAGWAATVEKAEPRHELASAWRLVSVRLATPFLCHLPVMRKGSDIGQAASVTRQWLGSQPGLWRRRLAEGMGGRLGRLSLLELLWKATLRNISMAQNMTCGKEGRREEEEEEKAQAYLKEGK